jgi:hypothetical protein
MSTIRFAFELPTEFEHQLPSNSSSPSRRPSWLSALPFVNLPRGVFLHLLPKIVLGNPIKLYQYYYRKCHMFSNMFPLATVWNTISRIHDGIKHAKQFIRVRQTSISSIFARFTSINSLVHSRKNNWGALCTNRPPGARSSMTKTSSKWRTVSRTSKCMRHKSINCAMHGYNRSNCI